MKKITRVRNGERILHKGDLTVDGDVGEGAVINVQDGSLIIEGSVGTGSRIGVSISEELRSKSVISGLGSVVVSDGGSVIVSSGVGATMSFGGSFVGKTMRVSGVHGTVKTISADQSVQMNGIQLYIGNVNINNRLLTNGQVKECGNEIYEISASSEDGFDMFALLRPSSKAVATVPVSATIDGIVYTGGLIRVEGKSVIVDGRRQAGPGALAATVAAEAAEDTPLYPPTLCIKGVVHDGVKINSDVVMNLQDIGRGCVLESTYEGIAAGNVGDETVVNVRGAIKVKNVGQGVKLNSSQYGIGAKNIGNRSTIAVRDKIDVENIGDFCTVTSQMYGIQAYNVGIQTTISVRDAISLACIASDAKISSQMYGLKAKAASNRVQIQVRDEVQLSSAGEACVISSQQKGIEVEGCVHTSSQLDAREDIIVGSFGDYTRVNSKQGRIKAHGPSGDHVVLQARESIHLKDVGKNAQITSTQNEVSLRNIGINATITAREDIDIDGTCPDPQSLNLHTGRGKRIQKPTKAPVVAQAPHANPPVVQGEGTYITGTYEGDFQRALELSQQGALVSRVGLFSAAVTPTVTATANLNQEITVPKGFECPICLRIMTRPVICTLDGRSYEESEITTWLATHRSSPFNRKVMTELQTIESVLIQNIALADSIEEFLIQHPEFKIGVTQQNTI